MGTVKYIGADAGNDALKLAWVDPEKDENAPIEERIKTLEVMNIIGQATHRRNLSKSKSVNLNPLNLLDVTVKEIKLNKEESLGRYFVGGLAHKESAGDYLERSQLDVKGESQEIIILLMTGLAYSLFDAENPIKDETIALGTSLPTEEFFSESVLDSYTNRLSNKKYVVEFHEPFFKGAKISMNFEKVEIQPEGTAPEIAYLFELDGKYKKGMEKVEEEVHLGINIGSITTEMSVFELGEFNPKGFKGMPIGTSKPLDAIIESLDNDMNVTGISRHKLDYIIRNDKPLTAYIEEAKDVKDITTNLKEYKDEKFNYFTTLLVNRINTVLSYAGINPALVNKVIMSGGGTASFFNEFKNKFKRAKLVKMNNPRFAVAIGNLIAIKMNNTEAEAAADEVLN